MKPPLSFYRGAPIEVWDKGREQWVSATFVEFRVAVRMHGSTKVVTRGEIRFPEKRKTT